MFETPILYNETYERALFYPDAWGVLIYENPTLVILSVFSLIAGNIALELLYYSNHKEKFKRKSWFKERWQEVALGVMCSVPLFLGLPYHLLQRGMINNFGPILSFLIGLSGVPLSMALKKLIIEKIIKKLEKW